MHLVQGSIDAHGGAESCHTTFVLLQPQQDAGQRGSDEAGRAERHNGANLEDETRINY